MNWEVAGGVFFAVLWIAVTAFMLIAAVASFNEDKWMGAVMWGLAVLASISLMAGVAFA